MTTHPTTTTDHLWERLGGTLVEHLCRRYEAGADPATVRAELDQFVTPMAVHCAVARVRAWAVVNASSFDASYIPSAALLAWIAGAGTAHQRLCANAWLDELEGQDTAARDAALAWLDQLEARRLEEADDQ